jgi:hydroxymethylglutaryl-CoA reductase
MIPREIIESFSKLPKKQKIEFVSQLVNDSDEFKKELASFWHPDKEIQKRLNEFSENTLTNYSMPYGISPNFIINNKIYHIPMVIEESSVVAAASKAAKYWGNKGGFKSEIISVKKIGQVHFSWSGNFEKLDFLMPELREKLHKRVAKITENMRKRGGGILSIELIDMRHAMENYYQLKVSFDTRDSMGANFINSVLEEFAQELKSFVIDSPAFTVKDINIIMSILSNYTPECLVKTWVECDIDDLDDADEELTAEEFAQKFAQAVKIAQIDIYRATTHNKGIFNGIDAVALATGNDFRAIEASGHAYASRNGQYASLTDICLENGKFKYTLILPLAMGTVGGLTHLHPLAKRSLDILGNPTAEELMMITATAGLANNLSAIKSLITKGIQVGHMKMHLLNILNHYKASQPEKTKAIEFFKTHKVSFSAVESFLTEIRKGIHKEI